MSTDAAVVAIVVSLALGLVWGRWLRAEADDTSARQSAVDAAKRAWRARWNLAGVGVVLVAVLDLWFHGRGRG